MTVTFRPLALREVLGLGRSIVRDFHPYELRGYRYARWEVLGGKAVALAVEAGGAYAGYLIHAKPDRHGLLRIAYLATEPRCAGATRTAPSTLRWRTRTLRKTMRNAG